MQLAEYSRAQRSIVAQAIQAILNIFIPYRGAQITDASWRFIVRGIFPIVDSARRESAVLMRSYYDSQRAEHFDDDYDIDLPSYELEWLEESLRPVFNEARVIEFDDAKVVETSLRLAKEIENGGRRLALNAVRGETRRVGFARVATGRETCAFCLMLVSRGPVYKSELRAGAKHEGAAEILETRNDFSDEELDELMTRWHPGCDCKVVPVFDESNWQGRDDYLRMRQIWIDYTDGFYGSQFTKNDKLNAFRRAIERGDINPAQFAAAA